MVPGIETGDGDQLTDILKGAEIAALGQEFAGSQVANPWNRGQQVFLPLQVGMLVESIDNCLFGLRNLLVKQRQLGLKVLQNRGQRRAALEPIVDLLAHLGQVVQVPHQCL